MPGVLKYENWDSATPPAAPSGWTFQSGSGLVTTATGPTPITSPNMISLPAGGAGNYAATWGTADGVSGNVQVDGTFNFFGGSGINTVTASVFGRANSISNPFGGTCYIGQVAGDSGAGDVFLYKCVSGTQTSLASVLGFTISLSAWYQISLVLDVTALFVRVIRLSDGFYLNNSGAWQGSITAAISIVNAVITGSGYAGWGASATASLPVFGDDWTLTGLTDPVIAPHPPTVVYFPFEYYLGYPSFERR